MKLPQEIDGWNLFHRVNNAICITTLVVSLFVAIVYNNCLSNFVHIAIIHNHTTTLILNVNVYTSKSSCILFKSVSVCCENYKFIIKSTYIQRRRNTKHDEL